MADLAKQLVEAVEKAFTHNCKTDILVSGIEKTLKKNGVSYREAEEYAARLGELLAKSYRETITPELLPEGRLDAELAEELLRTLLTQNYERAAEVAARVQTSLNRAAGLGMKGLPAEVNTQRMNGLIQKAGSYETYEKAAWTLDEPVVNYTQSAVEDTLRKNADAHFKSGLHPVIKRISVGGCCKWCNSLAGTYDYPVKREIYKRHERCRCLVLYDPGNGKIQDAHTKAVYEGSLEKAEKAARDERVKRASTISELSGEQYHRRIGKRNREIIDQPTYNKLTREFLRRDGIIYRDEEAERHLDASGNGAAYIMGANTVFFRRDATVSEVLEEMYHAHQDRTGMFNQYPIDEVSLRREIDAQKHVMMLKTRYKIPESEMEELQINLDNYEKELDELLRSKHENS